MIEEGNTCNSMLGAITPTTNVHGTVNPLSGISNQFQICPIQSPSPSQLLYSHWLATRNTNAIFGLQGMLKFQLIDDSVIKCPCVRKLI